MMNQLISQICFEYKNYIKPFSCIPNLCMIDKYGIYVRFNSFVNSSISSTSPGAGIPATGQSFTPIVGLVTFSDILCASRGSFTQVL